MKLEASNYDVKRSQYKDPGHISIMKTSKLPKESIENYQNTEKYWTNQSIKIDTKKK